MVIFIKQKQFLNPCDEIFHMSGDLRPLANTLSHLSEFSIFESISTKMLRGGVHGNCSKNGNPGLVAQNVGWNPS